MLVKFLKQFEPSACASIFLRKVRRADLLLIVCSCGKVIPCSSYSVAEESFQLLTKKTFAVQTDIRQKKIVCLAIDGLEKKKKPQREDDPNDSSCERRMCERP